MKADVSWLPRARLQGLDARGNLAVRHAGNRLVDQGTPQLAQVFPFGQLVWKPVFEQRRARRDGHNHLATERWAYGELPRTLLARPEREHLPRQRRLRHEAGGLHELYH